MGLFGPNEHKFFIRPDLQELYLKYWPLELLMKDIRRVFKECVCPIHMDYATSLPHLDDSLHGFKEFSIDANKTLWVVFQFCCKNYKQNMETQSQNVLIDALKIKGINL